MVTADAQDRCGGFKAHQIEVEVDEGVPEASSVDLRLVESAVSCILNREDVSPASSVNVLLTGDDGIRALNREFANDDHATDVLAFPADADEPFLSMSELVIQENGDDATQQRQFLGDIALSVHQVSHQALQQGIAMERELAMLVIHGTLHLLGYDHATPDEERVMFGKTDAALAELLEQTAS